MRLARKAEAMVYGKDVACDGPEFAGFRQEEHAVRIYFRNVGSGLMTTDGESPKGFVLGDRAGKLYPAEARIEGDTVVLTSASVPEPQRVRYAFAGFCRVNLVNREGFPAWK